MVENLPLKPDVLLHIIVNSIFALLAVIVVILRLVARKIRRDRMGRRSPLGIDNILIICAVVSIGPQVIVRNRRD